MEYQVVFMARGLLRHTKSAMEYKRKDRIWNVKKLLYNTQEAILEHQISFMKAQEARRCFGISGSLHAIPRSLYGMQRRSIVQNAT